MMFLPTNGAIIFKFLLHIVSTTDGYSVAVAGLEPTKEIIERDCSDPTFVPSYCPKNITDTEEDLTESYSKETKQIITGERSLDCPGLPSDAEGCQAEAGDDYSNKRQSDTKYKKSKRKRKRRKYSNKKRKVTEKKETNIKEKLNKRIEKRLRSVGGEMEMECMGLPWDPQYCMGTTTKAPKAPKAPKAAKAPKAPKAPKTPQNPNTKYSVKKLNNDGEIRVEAETECLGSPSDPDFCHSYANVDDYVTANGDDYEMANGDDYEMANGDDYEMANGDDYAYGKGNSKAAIVLKNDRLYLQFGANAEATKKHPRVSNFEKIADQDYMITGGDGARPHEFPWTVRIMGGCAVGKCGGSLISPRLVLSAFHCTYNNDHDDGDRPCDHSDEKRLAYLGRHKFKENDISRYDAIPIIDVKYPVNQGFSEEDDKSHDFAMLVLKEPARFSNNVRPICLPKQDQDFSGKMAKAAGWGLMAPPDVNQRQSPVLRKVDLFVSTKKYKHSEMFGTMLETNSMGEYKDACSGDSGGPLMYFDPKIDNYVLIGTVTGLGYDCRINEKYEMEGSTNGLWNKVSAWVDWIHKEMEEMGELGCTAQRKN